MNTHHDPSPSSGSGIGGSQGNTLGGYEERLLAELKLTVAEQSLDQRRVAASQPGLARGRAASGSPSRLFWRPALVGAASIMVAGAAAIAVIASSGAPAGTAPSPGGATAASLGAHGGGSSFEPATAGAAVLRNAALAALQSPADAPQPGQFVYSKVEESWGGLVSPIVDQRWLSVDGAQYGLDRITGGPGNPSPNGVDGSGPLDACRHGLDYDPHRGLLKNAPLPKGTKLPGYHAGQPIHCTYDMFGYLPHMPTNPDALRAYLAKPFPHAAEASLSDGDLLNIIERMTMTHYLLPKQRAALYELLAHMPKLTVVRDVANMQGTTGIGVRVGNWKGGSYTIIFDPKTYAPLGMNWTRLGKPAGEVQLKLAIVNRVGELP